MAGLYQRFRSAGYTTPKFLLPWQGGTVLDHILTTMLADGAFRRVLLVANRRDEEHASALQAILKKHGLTPEGLSFVPDTRGQAETAQLGARALLERFDAQDEAVVFHNIDTILLGRDFHAAATALAWCDGYIDVFVSDSDRYSYVQVGDNGVVTDIAEKRVISRHATSGLYGFHSASHYLAWAAATTSAGEFYISDVYRHMIERGCRITINRARPQERTVIVGTPEEYEALARAA
jgi:dTDP-glucose pyrophosphorylase